MSRGFLLLAWSGFCLTSVFACDSGPPPLPAGLEIVPGFDEEATVGKPVPAPPAVRVLNKKGKPMRGREVVFSLSSGGGLLSGNVSVTDREGVARLGAWVLGTVAGPQTIQARVPELPSLLITIQATAADPASVAIRDGNDQTGIVGSPLALSPSVVVRDVYKNLVPGASVEFRAVTGGGSILPPTAVTDASGIAEGGVWTLGTVPGLNTASASVEGLTPVTFTAEATPDVPSRLTVLLGDGQTGTVGADLPLRPTLQVADRFGNVLEGVPVEFEVISGGGSVADGQQVTASNGAAVSGPWTLGTTAGPQTLRISVSGLDPITLSATAEAGPPALAVAVSETGQTATVGTTVPVPPAVRVEDTYGNPVPGASVTFAVTSSPEPGGSVGSVDPAESVTDQGGTAALESWTLGTRAGDYQVSASVAGLSEAVLYHATATPDLPASLVILEGDDQRAPVGTPLPVEPSVRVEDPYGNGVPEIPVRFTLLEGGGSLTGFQAVTDEDGVATLGSWTLGPEPGLNRISASAEGIESVTFQSTGLSALPAQIVGVAGNDQRALVGTPVAIPPRVLVTDAGGNPVSSVPVTFTVTTGGGSVTGGEATTDSDGMARVVGWTLGTQAGTNILSASAGELGPVLFTATGTPGPPESMVIHRGDGQNALVNTPVLQDPAVILRDAYGNRTPDIPVTFSVTGGGGSVTGGTTSTDSWGIASVESWTLGPDPGANTLSASSSGLPDVVFTATALLPGGFDIELEFMTAVDPGAATVFQDAVARWEEIIAGDIPDYGGSLPAGGCQPVAEEGGIDDVKVYVTVEPIDGSGGVLGRAGPCYYKTAGGIFPITGVMDLDEADVADMLASGILEDVIIHELGHVLGFGTMWNLSSNDFLKDPGSDDPYFDGALAIAAFDAAGGSVRTDPKVPVENTGGPGTRDSHWRETVHNAELMTGWIEGGGVANPLSEITIASMADMGYLVDMTAADPYVLFNPLGAPPQYPAQERVYIRELPPPTPIPAGSAEGG